MTNQTPPTNEEQIVALLKKINDKLGFFVVLSILAIIMAGCSALLSF